jgi:hypothetical protein
MKSGASNEGESANEKYQHMPAVQVKKIEIDKKDYDGLFCKAEWLVPVAER